MQDDVVYNQVIRFASEEVDSRTVMRSYVEEGKLILVLDDSQKLLIDGRQVDTVGRKERIHELLASARGLGIALETKTVTHYAVGHKEDGPHEYVLIKW